MDPAQTEFEIRKTTIKMLKVSIFNLESIAHLRGKEATHLPLADKLREVLNELEKL